MTFDYGAATHPCLILIVDDNQGIREVLVELIEECGHHATSVEHGAAALAWLRTNVPPALILLDLMMPIMDGAGFRHIQRHDPVLAPIPTVIMSAYLDAVAKRDELAGAAYLRKPFDFAALERILDD